MRFTQIRWEKHKEQIRAYVAGSDIEASCEGDNYWIFSPNPSWYTYKKYRVKVTKKPKAGHIWKNRNGTYYVYSYEQGMVSLDTGEVYPNYDLGDVIYVCDHYTKIPR